MRKLINLVLSCLLCATLTGCSGTSQKDGSFEAIAQGNNGDVKVQVNFVDGKISEVNVLEHQESAGISDPAISKIPESIVENQSVNVEIVSGATRTSEAILNAVKDCIEQSGRNIEDWQKEITKNTDTQQIEKDCDVLVIGAGLGGMTSALSAAEKGANVLLIEKQATMGGNFILSTGIIQAGDSQMQKDCGIEDSKEQYYNDMMDLTEGKRNPVLVNMVVEHSGETVDWLKNDVGVPFFDEVTQGVGSLSYRAHITEPNASAAVDAIHAKLKTYDNVEIMLNTEATEFIMNDHNEVIGVKAKNEQNEVTVHAKKTIMAVGGYGSNKELLVEYWGNEWANSICGANPGVTGEMLLEAEKIGAVLDGMDVVIPGSPSVEVSKGQVITTLMLSGGGILVDKTGSRFYNETADTWSLTKSVMDKNDTVYEVFDKNVMENVHKASFYNEQGIVKKAETIEELAEMMNVDVNTLTETINNYNEHALSNTADEFGREMYVKPLEAPYYFMEVTTGVGLTHGGVVINENTQVLDKDSNPIGNLYAVGDSVGGYRAYGYVCGDANSLAATTGKIAGEKAAEALKN